MATALTRLRYLLQQYTERQASPEELQELEQLLEEDWQQRETGLAAPIDWQTMLETITREGRTVEELTTPVRKMNPGRWVVAAVVILLLGTGLWWLLSTRPSAPGIARVAPPTDIPAPATNRATITLAGGQRVYLDSAANGALAQQGAAQLIKQANGRVVYTTQADPLQHAALLYNTLTNPRGSQIVSLTLTDGTKVWLNAESSLRYPVAFTGPDRTVEIIGEAYFEVTHDTHKPFKVRKGTTTVEVLGTAFNVNAYTDEPTLKVTLLEGKVMVAKEANKLVLQPGQQAQVAGDICLSKDVDLESVMAWKNGRFAFQDADLPTVMRQLARWYDVTVRYQGAVPQRSFNGKISQNLTLEQVLHILTNHQIKYTIEQDRTLIIQQP